MGAPVQRIGAREYKGYQASAFVPSTNCARCVRLALPARAPQVVRSNFADDDAVPQRVTQLYMYKVDALLRHLLPEDESTSR